MKDDKDQARRHHARPVTSHEVARRAEVSRATVSRTFSNDEIVSEKTRAKVLRAAAELGYEVNMLGRSMNRQRAELVGVVVRRLLDPFRAMLLEPLLRAIAKEGFDAIVTEIGGGEESERAMRRFVQYRVSGVIVTSGSPPAAIASDCVRLEIPVVVINQQSDLDHVDIVRSDNVAGARLAADELIGRGCRSVGYLNAERSTYSGRARGAAFAKAIAAWRGVVFRRLDAPSPDYEGGFAAARSLRRGPGRRLDGVFCANDVLACGFIDGLQRGGKLKVPADISVIGFDDIPIAAWDGYRLTTIRQDVEALAAASLQCLLGRIERYHRPRQTQIVPVSLIERITAAPRR